MAADRASPRPSVASFVVTGEWLLRNGRPDVGAVRNEDLDQIELPGAARAEEHCVGCPGAVVEEECRRLGVSTPDGEVDRTFRPVAVHAHAAGIPDARALLHERLHDLRISRLCGDHERREPESFLVLRRVAARLLRRVA